MRSDPNLSQVEGHKDILVTWYLEWLISLLISIKVADNQNRYIHLLIFSGARLNAFFLT